MIFDKIVFVRLCFYWGEQDTNLGTAMGGARISAVWGQCGAEPMA